MVRLLASLDIQGRTGYVTVLGEELCVFSNTSSLCRRTETLATAVMFWCTDDVPCISAIGFPCSACLQVIEYYGLGTGGCKRVRIKVKSAITLCLCRKSWVEARFS